MLEQCNVACGKRPQSLWVPHDSHHASRRVAYRLDDAVFGKCPGLERRPGLRRTEIVVAINLRRLALDGDYLPRGDVARELV